MRGLCGRVAVAHKPARARWLNAPERRRRAGQRGVLIVVAGSVDADLGDVALDRLPGAWAAPGGG